MLFVPTTGHGNTARVGQCGLPALSLTDIIKVGLKLPQTR